MKIKQIFSSRYFIEIYQQVGLVVLAQALPVIFSPFIARIYDEVAMAELTGLLALAGLLLVFSTFKLENAIVIEEEDPRAKQILWLGIWIAIFFTAFSYLLVLVFEDFFVSVFEIEGVVHYLPLYILFFGILNLLNFWFVRIKKFKMKAYSKIIENGSYLLFAIVLYYAIGENSFGLAIGKIFGVLVALIILVKFTKVKWRKYSFSSHIGLLSKYREFPLHYMPSSFINVIGLQILVIFIGAFYTKEDLGFFGLANMVVLLPIAVVTQSVGTIFFQKSSEYYNKQEYQKLRKVFFQTFGMLAAIGLPAFLILYFGSRELFPFVFGSNWYVTGVIAEYMAIVFLAQIMIGPISIVLISLKKIKINAIWQYGRFFIISTYMLSLVYIFELGFMEFIEFYAYGAASLYLIYGAIILYQINALRNSPKHGN